MAKISEIKRDLASFREVSIEMGDTQSLALKKGFYNGCVRYALHAEKHKVLSVDERKALITFLSCQSKVISEHMLKPK